MKTTTKGFTLIELLVVVAIIGVLASVIITPIQNAQDKARVTKTVTILKSLERGFFAAAIEENRDRYWTSNELGGSVNIPLADVLAIEFPNPGYAISNYINLAQTKDAFGTPLMYRANTYSPSPCSRSADGIMIRSEISSLSLERRLALNTAIDGTESIVNPTSFGGVECGKVSPMSNLTGSGSYYLYRITRNPNSLDF